jgi:hypothetical protein
MTHYETQDAPFGHGYENAPATRLLATTCGVCRRPLVDAKSVETGLGPECRKKYGFNHPCSPEDRALANQLVYQIAAGEDDYESAKKCDRLRTLGFDKLATRIMERLATVVVTRDPDSRLVVQTPYDPAVVDAMRAIKGRKWDPERKVNHFPADANRALYHVMTRFYAGKIGIAPDGKPFLIK